MKQLAKTESKRHAQQSEQEIISAETASDNQRTSALKNIQKIQEKQKLFAELRKCPKQDIDHDIVLGLGFRVG